MALPSTGKGTDRGLGSANTKKPAPQVTRRSSLKSTQARTAKAARPR